MILGWKGDAERKRVAMVRERAAASGLGAEVRLLEEKGGQPREGKVLGFFENGFILAGPMGFFDVVPWRTVIAVTRISPNEVSVSRAGPTGRPIGFDARRLDGWTGVTGAEVLAFISSEVERFNAGVTASVHEEMTQARAAVRDGQRVTVGTVTVDADSVQAPASSVRWADLTRIVHVGNVLELYAGTARFQPALYLPERDVLDAEAFLELAAEAHRARTGRELPIEATELPAPASESGEESVDATHEEHGRLNPPPGTAEEILAKAEEKGLTGSPRWYIAYRRANPVPERGQLALFSDGFAMRSGKKVTAYHWDEVSFTTPTPTSPPSGGADGVVFSKPDNLPVLSNRTFREIRTHAGRLHQTHARYLLDGAVAAFVEGTELSFGAVTVTRNGFDYAGRSVAWSSVSGVRVDPADTPGPRDDLVVDVVDLAEPITITFGDLANSDAFMTLVGMMTRSSPPTT